MVYARDNIPTSGYSIPRRAWSVTLAMPAREGSRMTWEAREGV